MSQYYEDYDADQASRSAKILEIIHGSDHLALTESLIAVNRLVHLHDEDWDATRFNQVKVLTNPAEAEAEADATPDPVDAVDVLLRVGPLALAEALVEIQEVIECYAKLALGEIDDIITNTLIT